MTRFDSPAPARWGVAILTGIVCVASFAFFSQRPLSPDVAWLLDATGRWLNGARLYVDVREINPPLIFYDIAAISFGAAGKTGFVAGVSLAMAVSTLWCLRLAGWRMAVAALAAMAVGGYSDFGQREHLALICALPYLAASRPGRAEGAALGLWAFVGLGLKPHLLSIPLGASVASAVCGRSWRPLLAPQNLALGAACGGYLAFVALVHPAYLGEIVPLARFVYAAYGQSGIGGFQLLAMAVAAGVLALTLVHRSPQSARIAGALLGALAAYWLQGKWWNYQYIPAAGLTLMLALMGAGAGPPARRAIAALFAVLFVVLAVKRGPHENALRGPLPADAHSALYLSAHLWAAYPHTFENGVRQVSRYPALWPIPGAWNIAGDPDETPARKARARAVLEKTRAAVVDDILAGRPDYVIVDERADKPYFERPFDYLAYLRGDPRFAGYDEAGHIGGWRVLSRRD